MSLKMAPTGPCTITGLRLARQYPKSREDRPIVKALAHNRREMDSCTLLTVAMVPDEPDNTKP
jgi:hypothetical protein